jgi:hypothetical protein
MRDRGSPRHTRRLWRIQVQFVGVYDFDSVLSPVHSPEIVLPAPVVSERAERLIASQHYD